jgi:hypothetical protein
MHLASRTKTNWRKKMKKTLMVVLALSLFGSIALADDGDQGTGNYTGCTVNCPPPPPPPCTVDCPSGLAYQASETDTLGESGAIDTVWTTFEFATDYLLF